MTLAHPRAFKQSNSEWIGSVPSAWVVCALNYRYEVALGKMLDEKRITGNHLAPYLRNVDVQWDRINTDDLPEMDFPPDDTQRYSLRIGDLLVCEGGDVGRAAIWQGELSECYYQKALHRLRARDPKSDNPRFLFYALRLASSLGVFTGSEGKSTIAHLTAEALRRYSFAFPNFAEQNEIVSYLDREVAAIDALAAEQRYLVALLKEKRESTISEAVMKGLNHQVKMKRTGIEWSPDAPRHWDVVRLGTIFREIAESGDVSLPVLSVSIHHGVSDREFDEDELERKVTRSEDRSKYLRVQPDDLVYNMMRAWQGAFGTVKVDGLVSPAYVVARPRFDVCTQYIEWLLRTPQVIEELRRHSHGVTDFRLRLYWDEFKNIRLPLPPVSEQRAITARLHEEISKIDALTSASSDAIALLEERRTAFIGAVVTGKLGIRDAVFPPVSDAVIA